MRREYASGERSVLLTKMHGPLDGVLGAAARAREVSIDESFGFCKELQSLGFVLALLMA